MRVQIEYWYYTITIVINERNGCCHRNIGRLGLGLGLRLGLITQSGGWSSPMAFKDTGRWQEQLCDTSNHGISGGSSRGHK